MTRHVWVYPLVHQHSWKTPIFPGKISSEMVDFQLVMFTGVEFDEIIDPENSLQRLLFEQSFAFVLASRACTVRKSSSQKFQAFPVSKCVRSVYLYMK